MRAWLLLVCFSASVMACAEPGAQAEGRGEAAAAASAAEPVTIELREHLNVDWQNELVHFDVEAEQGQLSDGAVVVEGPGDAVLPAQLYDVERWPDGSVRTGRVAFVVDLGPLERHSYRLRAADADERATLLAQTDLAADVSVEGQAEVVTSRVGLRLLSRSMTFDEPVRPGDVPGPVVAMRTNDGVWYGRSAMHGRVGVVSYSGELIDAGPVFARWRGRYEYANDTVMTFEATLGAGDTQALWQMHTDRPDVERPELSVDDDGSGRDTLTPVSLNGGWRLYLTPGIDDLRMPIITEYTTNRWGERGDGEVLVDLAAEPAGGLVHFVPWRNWWDQLTKHALRFTNGPEQPVFHIASREPGEWIEPASPGTWVSHGNPRIRQQWVPLTKSLDGDIYLDFSDAPGWRKWEMGNGDAQIELDGQLARASGIGRQEPDDSPGLRHRLNTVKDYVLDWEGDEGTHPRLFVSREQLEAFRNTHEPDPELVDYLTYRSEAYKPIDKPTYRDPPPFALYLMTGDESVEAKYGIVDRLRTHLGMLGTYDMMRGVEQVVYEYDAIIDSPLIDPDERKVLQAQMAYLGYLNADPNNWSIERGFASGNLNMTVFHTINLGMLAAAIPEHPMAEQWSATALAMMEKWLSENVGPAGEFLGAGESVAHYSQASTGTMVRYGIAATNAGFADFVNDERLRRLLMFMAKQMTPPHPNLEGRGGTPPLGRGPSQSGWAYPGMMARATAESDPAFSRLMQWTWQRIGSEYEGALSYVYINPKLPAEAPDWRGMHYFPLRGAVMRHGVETPHEHYINFVLEPEGRTVFDSEDGTIPALWARGVPISTRFRGQAYKERETYFLSRVLPAWDVNDADDKTRGQRFALNGSAEMVTHSSLARQDYVHGRFVMTGYRAGSYDLIGDLPRWPVMDDEGGFPMQWERQVLFVRDDEPAGANYLVFRDTVEGGSPTRWQMWTKSEKIGTPEQISDREAFLADKPGTERVDASLLEGDHFTALGQYGVDVDYYIASPSDTPRHTLRMGISYHIPVQHDQYEDLLHLQRQDDGSYYVVMFPRDAEGARPSFRTVDEAGRIIEVSGGFGTDHVFLSEADVTAEAEGVRFSGTAGSVQQRGDALVLALAAAGSVSYDGYTLEAGQAAMLRVTDEAVKVEFAEADAADEVRIEAPMALRLADEHRERGQVTERDGGLVVQPASGVRRVMLVRE